MRRYMATPLGREQAVMDTVSFREWRRFETQRHRETQRGGASVLLFDSVRDSVKK